MSRSPDLEPPEGYYWYVTSKDLDGVTLEVRLYPNDSDRIELSWTWALTPRDLAKQERIEARIRACKRAILRKFAENQRIEAAIKWH